MFIIDDSIAQSFVFQQKTFKIAITKTPSVEKTMTKGLKIKVFVGDIVLGGVKKLLLLKQYFVCGHVNNTEG